MPRPEEAVHRACADYLRLIEKKAGIWWHHPANGGRRSKAEAGILKAMGVRAGTPDLCIIKAGRAYWIELKAPQKRLKDGSISQALPGISSSQLGTFNDLVRVGCSVGVAQSIDDLKWHLHSWGII